MVPNVLLVEVFRFIHSIIVSLSREVKDWAEIISFKISKIVSPQECEDIIRKGNILLVNLSMINVETSVMPAAYKVKKLGCLILLSERLHVLLAVKFAEIHELSYDFFTTTH